MNRVMVSGYALGSDPKLDVCQVCNFDLTWLFENPQILLWIDRIVVTSEILHAIEDSRGIEGDLGKGLQITFSKLESAGLIELKKVSDAISRKRSKSILKHIEEDERILLETFPEHIKRNEDDHLIVNRQNYCSAILWSIYASIELANKWNANLVLPPYAYNYLRYKNGISVAQKKDDKIAGFNKIFNTIVPKMSLFPHILFEKNNCSACAKMNHCRKNCLHEVEQNVKTILEWRLYDEFHQLREVLGKISKQVSENTEVSADDILNACLAEELKIRRRVKSIFPRVERWSNLVTILSVPMVVAGISVGSSTVASIGAATAGISTITNKYIETLKSGYRWVGYKLEK